MDPVTHTLLGAAVGQAFFRERHGPQAVPLLMIAGNLPDVDALVHLTADPAAIAMRRTFGHSVFLLPLWALALAWLYRRRWPGKGLGALWAMSMFGAAVHVFFDLVNSFGVLLLWPFSAWRPEFSIIFIIDLMLTGALAAPFLFRRDRLPSACRASLAAVAGYVVLCFAGRSLAQAALERAEPRAEFSYVFPEPFGAHRWRGVARSGEEYRVYLISPSGTEFRRTVRSELSDPRVAVARSAKSARWLEAFFKAPVWAAAEAGARVYDLRFRPLVFDRGALFEWGYTVDGMRVVSEGWVGR